MEATFHSPENLPELPGFSTESARRSLNIASFLLFLHLRDHKEPSLSASGVDEVIKGRDRFLSSVLVSGELFSPQPKDAVQIGPVPTTKGLKRWQVSFHCGP